MKMSATTVRRGLSGVFAGGLLGGVASMAIAIPTASAVPPETDTSCSISGVANTSSTVSASTSTYLESHPEANQALTDIAKQPEEQAVESFRAYFANNPQVETELTQINQPAIDLASQCGIEVEPTPITEALQDL
ncbi:MAG: hemophore-related protein [Mycobacterium sp.]